MLLNSFYLTKCYLTKVFNSQHNTVHVKNEKLIALTYAVEHFFESVEFKLQSSEGI